MVKKQKSIEIESPYLQKLTHSNLFRAYSSRPSSSMTSANRNHQSSSHFNIASSRPASSIAGAMEHLENGRYAPYHQAHSATAHARSANRQQRSSRQQPLHSSLHLSLRRERPSSAPVRAPSAASSHNKYGQKSQALFQRRGNLIRAQAYPNGSRQHSAFITARNLIEVSYRFIFPSLFFNWS